VVLVVGISQVGASGSTRYTVYLPLVVNGAAGSPSPTPTAPPGATSTPTGTPTNAPSATPTTSPPSVVQSVSPAPNATGVTTSTTIVIVFSTTMNQASVESGTTISPAIYGWTASWQGNTVTFRPAFALQPNTTYTVTLSSSITTSLATQTAGLPFTWSFTTGPVVVPAQPIAFARKDQSVGAEDLALMNPDGSGVTPITWMPTGVLTGDPAWRRDGGLLAFDSTFASANSTLDGNVFVANPDGSGVRMVTGHSFLGQQPGPTGAVAVTVQAPNLDPRCGQPQPGPGPFTITAQGTTNVVTNALPGGTYLLTNVPAGSVWVRVVGYYSQPPSGPGEVQGSQAVVVTAGQTTPVTIQLQVGQLFAGVPAWSPDGTRIAYLSAALGPVCAYNATAGQYQWQAGAAAVSIHLIAPDGSGDTDIYDGPSDPSNGPLTPDSLDWSPDGTKIVFGDVRNGIYTVSPNGPATQSAQLVLGGSAAAYQCGSLGYYCSWDKPRFSPDGTKLAYVETVLNLSTLTSDDMLNVLTLANGTIQTLVDFSANPQTGAYPGVSSWSPDGSQVAFTVRTGSPSPSLTDTYDIDVINADGTGLTPITTGGVSSQPAWR
jgi:Tol biopolymer transport system component